jgi:hypothetical protein
MRGWPVADRLPQTEADFQAAVIDLARTLGWRVAHFRPARTEQGWRTPVAADGKGFPDLVLCRDRVIYAELKPARGRVSDEQLLWLDALAGAGAEAHLWRPDDWPAIQTALTTRHTQEATPR